MKEFLSDFIKLLADCVIIICFVFASFLLLANLYHYKDITYQKSIDSREIYDEYKKKLATVDKKMKSVNIDNIKYDSTAKPIFAYYSSCKKALDNGAFAKFDSQTSFSAKDIYDANDEIAKKYNGKCIWYLPYNITVVNKYNKPTVSFNETYKLIEEKRKIIIDNADYLAKSGLGNSSYTFTTETSRNSVYNKLSLEYDLTINNYNMIVSILDDVADWYVLEFGGNN